MSKPYDIIKNRAAQEETATLVDVLKMGEAAFLAAYAADDIETCQTFNMVNCATIEALTERDQFLDAAIDQWCDELPDDRSLAQFVIDYYTGVSA